MSWQKLDTALSRRRLLAFLLAGGAAGLSPSILLRSAYGMGLLELPTATIGVRGTGVYAEPGARRSYYCNCYGTAEIVSSADPAETLTVQTAHHESPVYIYASRAESPIPGST